MRRKVVLQGGVALTIALPIKWAKENKIKKGDEVQLLQEGNALKVYSEKIKVEEDKLSTELIYNKESIYQQVSNLYTDGYDEIMIKSNSITDAYEIEGVAARLMGALILEQTSDAFIIKFVTGLKEEDFKNVFRRNFLVSLMIADSTCELTSKIDMTKKNKLHSLQELQWKLSLFCKRFLNKKLSQGSIQLYSILKDLERITGEYIFVYDLITKEKIPRTPELIEMLKNFNVGIRESYQSIFNNRNLDIFNLTGTQFKNLSERKIIQSLYDPKILAYEK